MPVTATRRASSPVQVVTQREDLPLFDTVISRNDVLPVPHGVRGNAILVGRGKDVGQNDITLETLRNSVYTVDAFWILSPGFMQTAQFKSLFDRARILEGVKYIEPKFIFATSEIITALHESADKAQSTDTHRALESDTSTLFKQVAQQAFNLGASDIHIHAWREKAFINVRVNGIARKLQDLRSPDFAMALIRTLYSMADPSSRSSAQFDPGNCAEARIEIELAGARLSFRYQQAPVAPAGLDVVMRMIVEHSDKTQDKLLSRAALGYAPSHDREMTRMFTQTTGMVLLTGVVNSGKSTTLRHETRRILTTRSGIVVRTIEDPVEYIIPGASQIPVPRGPNGESLFNVALKACLRMDNNVIMLGEIRDAETASIAADAVQTGHQILSTLHTASALESVQRLRQLGIDNITLGRKSFISGLVYQKLLPRLCAHCRVPLTRAIKTPEKFGIDKGFLRRLRKAVGAEAYTHGRYYMQGAGCEHCNNSGIGGRASCAETVLPTDAMRQAWQQNNDLEAERIWRANWKPLWDDFHGKTAFEHALSKMIKGEVSPKDIEGNFHLLDARAGFDELKREYIARHSVRTGTA
ncbi:MAG: hypothetical protein CVV05_00655 [Gammaproteobacteria bacterium HGW-Gammaproteobacteria-1]|jgi:type II secretory ATPase GspE/PulE/Tfp pilus assembly ATPase PilB-like protein|nr:MAG: hypothetical protein CVV05_00655 [Gammaproteobacteria bacterium HGW-Gammaproteobacteria-1]